MRIAYCIRVECVSVWSADDLRAGAGEHVAQSFPEIPTIQVINACIYNIRFFAPLDRASVFVQFLLIFQLHEYLTNEYFKL